MGHEKNPKEKRIMGVGREKFPMERKNRQRKYSHPRGFCGNNAARTDHQGRKKEKKKKKGRGEFTTPTEEGNKKSIDTS